MACCCCNGKKEDVISLTDRAKSRDSIKQSEAMYFSLSCPLFFSHLHCSRSPIRSDHISLLSNKCAEVILQNLPIVLQCDMWECVYNLLDHGSDIASFYSYTSGLTHTIIVIETIDGYKFGGFSSGEWKISQEYFGNGTSFVFSIGGVSLPSLPPCR
jgi:hypothetical protein